MAYGRIYIDNLRKKVTVLFDELRADNRLGEDNFIEAFKRKYPQDYASLVYEWEFKVHEFKKNRKGQHGYAETSDAFIAAVHIRCIAIWVAIRT